MSVVYVGRQPILDRQGLVVGYELLQRRAPGEEGAAEDEAMTMAVTAKALLDFGIENLVGDRDAYVNSPAGFLAEQHYLALPVNKTVLEIVDRVDVSARLLADIRKARSSGYRVALDNYTGESRFDPLLTDVDMVKVDIGSTAWSFVPVVAGHVRRQAPRVKLVAEKVETRNQVTALQAMGFDFFQGFYFAEPTVLEAKQVTADAISRMQLISALSEPDIDVSRVADLVSYDPGLSYRMLRLVNSAAFGMHQKVESVHRAATMLGTEQIRRLALLTVATTSQGPDEVLNLALTRARMCEQLARRDGHNHSAAFTVGLFSLLDVAMGTPMAALLEQLPLTAEVSSALLQRVGPLGNLLSEVIRYERGGAHSAARGSALVSCYIEAVTWSRRLRTDLEPAAAGR
jgi:EAL and modified HD-GYP domain-containing signal transduction protein